MNLSEETRDPRVDVRLLAFYGPQVPVLVVFVRGTLDIMNQHVLFSTLSAADEMRSNRRFKSAVNCRIVAHSSIVDFREASFVSGRTLVELSRHRDLGGDRLRLVLRDGDTLRRHIELLGLKESFDVYDSLVDALVSRCRHP